jgi:hypothetical protein
MVYGGWKTNWHDLSGLFLGPKNTFANREQNQQEIRSLFQTLSDKHRFGKFFFSIISLNIYLDAANQWEGLFGSWTATFTPSVSSTSLICYVV